MDKKYFKRIANNLLKRFIRAKVFTKRKDYQVYVNMLATELERIYTEGYSEAHEHQMKMRILDQQENNIKSTYREG